jgi:RecB family endonuclease NucS
LQSAIRRHLMFGENLRMLLSSLNFGATQPIDLEVLGEKALAQGHIDLLLKQRVPIGFSLKLPIEVKTAKADQKDLAQLRAYMDELLEECPIGILIAADFNKQVIRHAAGVGVKLVRYGLNADLKKPATFEEIWHGLALEPLAA